MDVLAIIGIAVIAVMLGALLWAAVEILTNGHL